MSERKSLKFQLKQMPLHDALLAPHICGGASRAFLRFHNIIYDHDRNVGARPE